MASEITNYQCPACTAPLRFDGASEKLVCDFCGSTYEVSEMEALYADKDKAAAKASEQAEKRAQETSDGQADACWDADENQRAYQCPHLRRGADLRKNHRRYRLPLLRQSHRGARPTVRSAEAGICAPLQN